MSTQLVVFWNFLWILELCWSYKGLFTISVKSLRFPRHFFASARRPKTQFKWKRGGPLNIWILGYYYMVLNNITSHCRAVNSAGCDVNKEKGVRAFLFFSYKDKSAHIRKDKRRKKSRKPALYATTLLYTTTRVFLFPCSFHAIQSKYS